MIMNKQIKNKIVLFTVYAAVGVVCILVAAFAGLTSFQSGVFSGLGAVMLVFGIASMIRYSRIGRNPERAEEWLAMQSEERTVFIAQKARAWTFYVFLFIELAIGLFSMLILDDSLLGEVLCYLVAGQGLTYAVLFKVFNKKY